MFSLERLVLLQIGLKSLWVEAAKDETMSGEVGELLAKAADCVADARQLAEHPGLKRLNCINGHAVEREPHRQHRLISTPRLSVPICGEELSPTETWMPSFQPPTCAKCIAVLLGEQTPAEPTS